MITLDKLKDLLTNESQSKGNKEGDTPLFNIAEKISKSDKETVEKIENIIKLISISSLDEKQTNLFLSFIYYSNLITRPILDYLYKEFKEIYRKQDRENTFKSLVLMRFIIERNKDYFSLNEIFSYEHFKSQLPWIWTDCLAHYNVSTCISEVRSLLSSDEDGIRNLLPRLPYYEKLFGKEDLIRAVKGWFPNLTERDRRKLEKWVSKFKIKLGLSILSEKLIEDIPFSQIQIT